MAGAPVLAFSRGAGAPTSAT